MNILYKVYTHTNFAKITEILNNFGKPGHRATNTWDDDFYSLVDSLLTDSKFLLWRFGAERMLASQNFLKRVTFGLFWWRSIIWGRLDLPDTQLYLNSMKHESSVSHTWQLIWLCWKLSCTRSLRNRSIIPTPTQHPQKKVLVIVSWTI